MGTSIRISEETKRKLEAVKREDETFDQLLDRIVIDRTEGDVEELLAMGGRGVGEHMRRRNEELSKSLEANAERE